MWFDRIRELVLNQTEEVQPLNLRLDAWTVLGNIRKHRDFEGMLPNSSLIFGGRVQKNNMSLPRDVGLASVIEGQLIYLRCLYQILLIFRLTNIQKGNHTQL